MRLQGRRFGGTGERKSDDDGSAEVGAGAAGGSVATVLAGDVADKEEAEAGPFDLCHIASGDAVEAVEDAFELVWRKADAGVGDGEGDPGVARDGQRATDVDTFGGVFDGVVQDIDDCGAEVFGDAESVEADGAGSGLKYDAARRKVVALDGDGDAVGDEGFQVDDGAVLLAVTLAELAGFENLLDGSEETVGVGEHDLVKLLFLFFRGGPALEGFKVEANAGDGGFELVSDGVEEGVLAFVAADLADKEDGVEDDAGDEGAEEDDAQDRQGDSAFVEDDPGDVEGDGEADGEHAEGDEGGDSSAAASDVHGLEEV